jgi:phosphohistidine phosphatase
VLLTSPLARARATAEIAAHAFKRIVPTLEPALADESVNAIMLALKSHPPEATIALVGHEPGLSALLARLVGASQRERVAFRKGGAALLDLPNGLAAPARLIWFLPPRVLRAVQVDEGPGVRPEDAD